MLVGTPEGKGPFGKPRRKRKDNFNVYRKEVWSKGDNVQTSGGLLWTRKWIIGFRKFRDVSWLYDRLSPSLEGICSMKHLLEIGHTGLLCFADCLYLHHQRLTWWVLWSFSVFIRRAIGLPIPDRSPNGPWHLSADTWGTIWIQVACLRFIVTISLFLFLYEEN